MPAYNWPSILQEAAFKIFTTNNTSSGHTPLCNQRFKEEERVSTDEMIEKAKEKYKIIYDKNKKETDLINGDMVLIKRNK